MSPSAHGAPPLSPVLIAGFALRPLPPALLQPILTLAMRLVRRRHPDVFERLAGLDDPVFLIDPVDLPLRFLLHPHPEQPSLIAIGDRQAAPTSTATVRGPLLALIDLLEGRVDGDTLFFSRRLSFKGDTEAVIALRNAVDGAEIRLVDDVLSVLGPASAPARRAVDLATRLFDRAARDLETFRQAVVAPAQRHGEAQAAMLHRLEERVAGLDRAARRAPRGSP